MAKKYIKGHTNFNSAYEVDDYPYGFNQRTKFRTWIETNPKKGDRKVSVTLNPKTGRWNKPKASTYMQIGVLYLDEKGHVQWNGVSSYASPDEVESFVKEVGGEKMLNKDQLKRYKEMTGGVSDEDITFKYKFEKDRKGENYYALDIRFDVPSSIKVKKIIEAVDEILKNKKNSENFKSLMDNDGIIRVLGRRGVMLGGPYKAKSFYDQIKKFLKNKIRESKINETRMYTLAAVRNNKVIDHKIEVTEKELDDAIELMRKDHPGAEMLVENKNREVFVVESRKNKKFVPKDWQKDPNRIKTDKVQFWKGLTMLTAQMKKADAQRLVKSGKAFVISDQAIGALEENKMNESKKKLSVPEKHQLRIAKQTLGYSDVGASIMGGMTKEKARAFLKKVGYSDREIKKMEESKITEGLHLFSATGKSTQWGGKDKMAWTHLKKVRGEKEAEKIVNSLKGKDWHSGDSRYALVKDDGKTYEFVKFLDENKITEMTSRQQTWMKNFEQSCYKLGIPHGKIGKEGWQNAEYLYSQKKSPEEAAKLVKGLRRETITKSDLRQMIKEEILKLNEVWYDFTFLDKDGNVIIKDSGKSGFGANASSSAQAIKIAQKNRKDWPGAKKVRLGIIKGGNNRIIGHVDLDSGKITG